MLVEVREPGLALRHSVGTVQRDLKYFAELGKFLFHFKLFPVFVSLLHKPLLDSFVEIILAYLCVVVNRINFCGCCGLYIKSRGISASAHFEGVI